MANEIAIFSTASSPTFYGVVYTSVGTVWDPSIATPAAVDEVVADWADYGIDLAETASGSYHYCADFPSTATAGTYTLRIFNQAGETRDKDDRCDRTVWPFVWDGQSVGEGTPDEEICVTLDEAKLHLRVDADDDDNLITALIVAAQEYAERVTRRTLLTTARTLYLDRFPPGEFELPYPPVASVTAIEYVDADGATQTWSSDEYTVDTRDEEADPHAGRVYPAYGYSWPSPRAQKKAITVTYVAGYGDSDDVPERAKAAIKLLVGHWYANREALSPVAGSPLDLAVTNLLWSLKTW